MPIPPPEVIEVTKSKIACDGGGGAAGHPRVWVEIDPAKGYVECGYCDRKFVLKPGATPDH
ncbi:zinc-finger domain-containing protein [Amaricoccus sp.]|uniref:zinc-finger domain-containing protein n=1 Tax=Amaricoccus sp. TaxID=1872485 RepID=UPI00260911DE|nr:zinc-finger domain-containing protein [uncultured Amaricoccus sp.]